MCDAHGRRKELDISITGDCRSKRSDCGDQSVARLDLGSGEGIEGIGGGMCCKLILYRYTLDQEGTRTDGRC